jgi:aspartate 4-decarboxylase
MADLQTLRKFQALSPFEIKNELIELAKEPSKTTQSAFLNAGRGNPNWIATTPREGFFLLGQFAVTESQRVMTESPGIGGMPHPKGIAGRLNAWLGKHADMPGAAFLSEMVKFAIGKFSFDPDAFVHELVDSIIGDNYPVPDRMLVHNERIVHEYLMWAMCGDPLPPGKFDLYAVEGGTAAMCYIFKSLKANRLLMPGDTIALGTPIFTPYLEMTHLEDYDLKVVNIAAPQENRFQYSDAEIKKLEDPKIKAFFIVNPGNPTGMAMSKETIAKIVKLVKTKRPDLMLLTDDVYGTFVENFRSLMGELPYNTIGRLFVFEIFRLHRLAARCHRDPREQPLRQDDRRPARQGGEGPRQALRADHARAAQDEVHRPHRRRQPRHRPQSHGRALAAATGHDDHVFAV